MHKNGSSSTNYSIRKVDGWKINKHGGSNKGMVGGSPFFCKINTGGATPLRYLRVNHHLGWTLFLPHTLC